MNPHGAEAPTPGGNAPFTDLPPPGSTTAGGVHAPGPPRGQPAAPRQGASRRTRRWVLLAVVVVVLLLPAGRAVMNGVVLFGSTGDPAPTGTGTAAPGSGPGGAGEAAPAAPGWAHAGGSGPARHATARDADLCARLDRAAFTRAFGRPAFGSTHSAEPAAGGVSLLCVFPLLSEPAGGPARNYVTRVSATFAADPAAAARFYDQAWATASADHAGGEETRDPDGLGDSAFGFTARPRDGSAEAEYLVSVLDSNLVLTVELRVFGRDPVGSKERSRGLAKAFELTRNTLARLA
jgi:hypothetical protein